MLASSRLDSWISVYLLAVSLSACSSPDGTSPDPSSTGGDASMGGEGGDNGDGDGDHEGSGGTAPSPIACDFGNDADKCEGAADVACTPVPVSTGEECNHDDNCPTGALCFEQTGADASSGVCMDIRGYCLPRCGGDFDCPDDLHCNPSSGRCEDTAREGLSFGKSCLADEDACAGRCVSIDDSHAECEENCRVGASSGCGEVDIEDSDVACAFFAYDLTDIDVTQGAGDLGVCAHLCTCNDDCPDEQRCLPQAVRGFPGVCAGGVDLNDSIECDTGLGGAGPK